MSNYNKVNEEKKHLYQHNLLIGQSSSIPFAVITLINNSNEKITYDTLHQFLLSNKFYDGNFYPASNVDNSPSFNYFRLYLSKYGSNYFMYLDYSTGSSDVVNKMIQKDSDYFKDTIIQLL